MSKISIALVGLLFSVTIILQGCGGADQEVDEDENNLIDRAIDEIYDQDIERFSLDLIDDIDNIDDAPTEPSGEDSASDLIICPFPESLQDATAAVFNTYTSNESNSADDFSTDFSLEYSEQYYLSFYDPVELSMLSASQSGADAIIQVTDYGTATLQNFYQGAAPRGIVINNLAFEPYFFFKLLNGEITTDLQTTPPSLEEAFYMANGIGPKARDIITLPENPICDITEKSFQAGVVRAKANYEINLAQLENSGFLSGAREFQYSANRPTRPSENNSLDEKQDEAQDESQSVTLFAVIATHSNEPPIIAPEIRGLRQTYQSFIASKHMTLATSQMQIGDRTRFTLDPNGNNAVFSIFTLPNSYDVISAMPTQTSLSSITTRKVGSIHLGVGFTDLLLSRVEQQSLINRNWGLTPSPQTFSSQTLAYKASIDETFTFIPRNGGLILENIQLILSLQHQSP